MKRAEPEEKKMAQPQVIQGSWEELSAQADAFKYRDDMLLIIPARKSDRNGAYPSETAEEKEKARIAAIQAARGSMAHVGVSVDDLHRERQRDKEKEEQQIKRPTA